MMKNESFDYLCIDMKSFYASCECVRYGLNPMTTSLVVADRSRGDGALCLAVSPALKAKGVSGRARLFEIPKKYRFYVAKPHMHDYMTVSSEIYDTLLDYVAPEDIHPYSIDESFVYIKPYKRLYRRNAKEMAQMLMAAIYDKTGIPSAAGIGTNLFLTKLALDITAKHQKDRIGILDENTFKKTLWHHKPITDIWQISRGISHRLSRYGMTDLKDVASCPEKILYSEFGINAQNLINHSWGKEPATIADIKKIKPKEHSLSNSQILFEDYTVEDALLILREMSEELTIQMTADHLTASSVSLYVGYSKSLDIRFTGGSKKFAVPTSTFSHIYEELKALFLKTTHRLSIRQIGISFGGVSSEQNIGGSQLDFIANGHNSERELRLQRSMAGIKTRYGKNAVLRASCLFDKSTQMRRNGMIGGHRA